MSLAMALALALSLIFLSLLVAVKGAKVRVPLNRRQVELVLVVEVDRAKGAARGRPALATVGQVRIAVKVVAVGGKSGRVSQERRLELMALLQLVLLIDAVAGSIGTSANENLFATAMLVNLYNVLFLYVAFV